MEEYKFWEPVYKEFTVNNETIGKWAQLNRIVEFDTKGNAIYVLWSACHLLLLDGNEIHAIPRQKDGVVNWDKT
ncbi:MAG: hypothetical protein IJP61_08935 [Treponema sp.]|nr:hypothetical protein [Treponema sp.]